MGIKDEKSNHCIYKSSGGGADKDKADAIFFAAGMCRAAHLLFERYCRAMSKTQADLYICYTPDDKGAALKNIFGDDKIYFPQMGESLGERMYMAIQRVLAKDYGSCVLIGTDVPEIKQADLDYAFRLLDVHDIVLGPTQDGGYYLVGMKKPVREVFENKLTAMQVFWKIQQKQLLRLVIQLVLQERFMI